MGTTTINTTTKKTVMPECRMEALLSMAGSDFGCTMVLLGIGDACNCLCNFAWAGMQHLGACSLIGSQSNTHDQWRACAAQRAGCGRKDDVVVVHGRHLRTTWTRHWWYF